VERLREPPFDLLEPDEDLLDLEPEPDDDLPEPEPEPDDLLDFDDRLEPEDLLVLEDEDLPEFEDEDLLFDELLDFLSPESSSPCSASSRLRTLPVGLRGSSSMYTTSRGTL
jgi:hypothetical protein